MRAYCGGSPRGVAYQVDDDSTRRQSRGLGVDADDFDEGPVLHGNADPLVGGGALLLAVDVSLHIGVQGFGRGFLQLFGASKDSPDGRIISKALWTCAGDHFLGFGRIDGLDLCPGNAGFTLLIRRLPRDLAIVVQEIRVENLQLLDPVIGSDELNLGTVQLFGIIRPVVRDLGWRGGAGS
jgi:hypothetical protein